MADYRNNGAKIHIHMRTLIAYGISNLAATVYNHSFVFLYLFNIIKKQKIQNLNHWHHLHCDSARAVFVYLSSTFMLFTFARTKK